MRRFTKQLHHVISLFIGFLQRGVDTIFPSRPHPAARSAASGGPRRPRVRGVHAVPLVAVLALGATAFAVNSGATPESTPIAVGDQVPHSTPTTENPADVQLRADIDELVAARERAAADKAAKEKAAAEKAAKEKAAAEKAAEEQAAIEKLAAAQERAAAEQAAEAERNAQTAQQEPAPQPVSASGACGGNLPPCCVMMRESGGNPTAVNASSGAAGKWQFMTSTWANYKGYPNAAAAPEHVQDERAAQLWAGGAGAGHWGGGCW